MKPDIRTREDIEQLLRAFYESVKPDPVIGYIFTDVVQIDWDHHIPLIADFWESILLDNPVYKRNAMEVHYGLNSKVPLEAAHFERWLRLFYKAVDGLYAGETAELAKRRARSVAGMMQYKMEQVNKKTQSPDGPPLEI